MHHPLQGRYWGQRQHQMRGLTRTQGGAKVSDGQGEARQKSEQRGDKQSRDGWSRSRWRLSGRQQHSFISRPLLGGVRARNASFLPLFQPATLFFQASSFNTSPLLSHKSNQLPRLTDSTSAVPFTIGLPQSDYSLL